MSRFEVVTVVIIAAVFGGLLVTFERARVAHRNAAKTDVRSGDRSRSGWPIDLHAMTERIAAPGRIEGITETVEIRPRLSEAVVEVFVEEGDWVEQGDLLVRLDPDRLDAERKLAAARSYVAPKLSCGSFATARGRVRSTNDADSATGQSRSSRGPKSRTHGSCGSKEDKPLAANRSMTTPPGSKRLEPRWKLPRRS